MRLITHNLLQCNIKGVTNGFPLGIEAGEVEAVEQEFDGEFIQGMLPKLEWPAFVAASAALGVEGFPPALDDAIAQDAEFLKRVHHALLEVNLKEGNLVCPETGRKFPVKDGIPNMLLNEVSGRDATAAASPISTSNPFRSANSLLNRMKCKVLALWNGQGVSLRIVTGGTMRTVRIVRLE
jgi:multifunctional methyltransferase subunit TRM112